MRINQTHINEIIEKGNKISCEKCNCKTFKMFSARIDDEGNLSSGKSEYFTRPIVITACVCCGHSSFEVGETTIPDEDYKNYQKWRANNFDDRAFTHQLVEDK